MRIAIAQINVTVGDLRGNETKILQAYRKGQSEGADLVITPELALTGYPPKDLLLQSGFIDENLKALDRIARQTEECGLIVGYVARRQATVGRPLRNAAALLHQGRQSTVRFKTLLPSYDVFDEDRYFEPASENSPIRFRDQILGLTICEDAWNQAGFWNRRRYSHDPVQSLLGSSCDLLINISASPWHLGKRSLRTKMLQSLIEQQATALVYCNLVGGNDELVFDGGSLAWGKNGALLCQADSFREDFRVIDLRQTSPVEPIAYSDEEKIYSALVLGIRDYVAKCRFRSALIGLSGGIDSAVTAALATAALGPENTRTVAMPSRYSSPGSLKDAARLAENLNIHHEVIPIETAFESVTQSLAPAFGNAPEDVTEENIQARLRGLFLMALSNKYDSLLITTGNKSELAVGYCTLYGDMCGGLAAISDVPKTMVYRLAHWINRDREIIPVATIEKPPSAELRPDQTDQDFLPPYDVLDQILQAYIVDLKDPETIISDGMPEAEVRKTVRLIETNEFKRRQAAPGLKVTGRAFGMGRRMPIARRQPDLHPDTSKEACVPFGEVGEGSGTPNDGDGATGHRDRL